MKIVLDANGVIVNASETGPWDPPVGGSVVALTQQQRFEYYTALGKSPKGLAYVGGVFIPQTATAGFFMRALIELGFYNAIAAVVAGSGNPTAQVLWNRAIEFPRQDPLLIQMATAAGMSSADIDAVYIRTATY